MSADVKLASTAQTYPAVVHGAQPSTDTITDAEDNRFAR